MKTLKVRLISDLQKLEDKRDDKIKVFKSDYKLLQQQITALTQQNKETQQHYDVMEQYCCRLSLMTDSVPKENNEKAEDVFKFVKGLTEGVLHLEILKVVIYRTHRTGPNYINKKCRKGLYLLLFTLQQKGNEYIKSIGHTAKFRYADINCQIKIKWADNSEAFLKQSTV